ncbi:carbamoyltransferase C-terminal domain-containing protein [Nonomuraea sp. NPDC049158]|uniref:carbamoyltransferase family protein n=1 Tax=Nonomuraea sp. NPDC049158 TaxID=3155649 RepID=UPI0033C8742C
MIVLGYNGFGKVAELFARYYGSTGIDRHMLYGHDSSAALMVDGELVAAVEEERLNREKKTARFPAQAIAWVLREAGKTYDEVDVFAHSWRFSQDVMNNMIAEIVDADAPVDKKFARLRRLDDTYTRIFSQEAILADFHEHTGHPLAAEKLVTVPHHLAHLMTGYHLSGGGEAAFVVSDGRAEWLSAILGEVRDGKVRLFDDATVDGDNSLALLFAVLTRYLGFVPNNDEYKVMGLAGHGPPPEPNPLLKHVVALTDNGRYTIPYAPRAVRAYYALFDRIFDTDPDGREDFDVRVRVAGAAQEMVEAVTAHQLRALEERSALPRLLFEGGLALNCVNNTKLLEGSRFAEMDVSFGASDPGVAIGAAFYASQEAGDKPRVSGSPYLGPAYGDDEIRATLDAHAGRVEWRELAPGDVARETAALLREKCVLGWFQGRTEYGPRALGNRSILANPRFGDIKDIINDRIKHREPFRPFAPVVLEDVAPEVFEMGKKRASPYMTFVFPVRPGYRDLIPGATHVDGTSRIQTIREEDNPLLAELLRAFTELTGVPCLINTSFNVAGEPIVCSPADAMDCFLKTEMDYLVLGRFVATKSAQR